MLSWPRDRVLAAYERLLEREIDRTPSHVAVIQDGNRRYAREEGTDVAAGHRAGAQTTAHLLEWCRDFDIEELTVYAFSTENFDRPANEREELYALFERKLREFADEDAVHDNEVGIRVIGRTDRLPEAVQSAIEYAERRTAGYDRFLLNVALAYGGRRELLDAARSVAAAVANGDLDPADVDVGTVDRRLYDRPKRDVDLIIRTGGDERTSNFLPWHANGNEAAVYFCAPLWPEFSKLDFLRGIRTWEHREASRRRNRARRGLALLGELGGLELEEARRVVRRWSDTLPRREVEAQLEETGDVADVGAD